MQTVTDYEIVIVGGGLSGLAAADRLLEAGKSCIVLEAREALGGRVRSAHPEFGYLDEGGEFLGETQHYVWHYTKLLEVPTSKTYLPMDKDWLYEGPSGVSRRFSADPDDFPGGVASLVTLGWLDSLALQMRCHLETPWTMPGAAALDAMSADGLMAEFQSTVLPGLLTLQPELQPFFPDGALPQDTRDAFRIAVRSTFSQEPADVSALFTIYYAACAGTFSRLVDVQGGEGAAEGTRFVYGAASLVEAMAEMIAGKAALVMPEHAVFALGQRVERIENTEKGVLVTVGSGETATEYSARAAIVALAPKVAERIAYSPDLPGGRRALHQEMSLGHTIKGYVLFNSPFWRVQGLSGYALAYGDDRKHPLDWTLDNCWDGPVIDRPRYPYSLMTFIVGDAAAHWAEHTAQHGPADEQEAVIRHLERIYGPQVRSELVSDAGVSPYVRFDMKADATALGGPAGLFLPSSSRKSQAPVQDLFSALRTPTGNIHWAGSESATEWCGYMNGAIQAGLRAAGELL